MSDKTNPRIEVGVDGSEPSKRALRWAIEQARCVGATIDAIDVWGYAAGYEWAPVVDPTEVIKAAEQVLSEAIHAVAGERTPVTIRARVVEGHPAYELIRAAEGAQLLVLGSRGHGGFVGVLLGSVSQYCVQHATCPVVIVR